MTILHIETSGLNCSVALSKDNRILAEKSENAGKFTHSENLHLFIEAVMQQASLPLTALDMSLLPPPKLKSLMNIVIKMN